MLRLITQIMMILFCLCGTVMAFQSIRSRQFAALNSMINSISCDSIERMCAPIFPSKSGCCFFSFFTLLIMFSRKLSSFSPIVVLRITLCVLFALFTFLIFSISLHSYLIACWCLSVLHHLRCTTNLTRGGVTIAFLFVFVKVRQRFDLLAFCAGLVYDLLSHIRFLSKRHWLGPAASTKLALGPFILSDLSTLSRRKSSY